MALINPLLGSNLASTGFDTTLIGNSVWLDGSADCLTKSLGSGAAQSRLIISTWVQRTAFSSTAEYAMVTSIGGSYSSAANRLKFEDDKITVHLESTAPATTIYQTTAVYRDIGWYHVLLSIDGNVGDSMNLYVNGIEQTTSITYGSTFTGSLNSFAHSGATTMIGKYNNTVSDFYFLPGYLAQTTMIVGQSIQNGDLAVSDFLDTYTFGTNGSQFIPKADASIAALASTAGGNSFCLDFADSADLGNDISSNNNDFTPNSMSSANQSSSTPSNVYATWNSIQHPFPTTSGSLVAPTLTEGNLRAAISSGNRGAAISSLTIPAGAGKFAAKFTVNTIGGIYPVIGVYDIEGSNAFTNGFTATSDSVGLRMDGQKYVDGSSSSYGSAVSASNTVEVELDMDNNTVEFLINGSAQGTISKTFTGRVGFMIEDGTNTGGIDVTAEFDYTPNDSSFLTLNTANLTAPDYQGIDYFDSTLYEGNGTGQRVGDFVPFTDAYAVTNSAMFQHDDVRYLSRTIEAPSSTGGKKGTWSAWFKTALVDGDIVLFDTGTTATNRFSLNMDASGQIIFSHKSVTILKTSADLKGDCAWHNVVLKVDTSQGTASNRAAMFIDGVEITSFEEDRRDNTNLPQDNEIGYMDEGATQFVGSYNGVTANQWDGYLAEVVFLDNQYLDASSFGQLDTSTNRWIPKDVSGLTFGNCGSYLEFEGTFGTSNGAGDDSSGNTNNFTEGGTWATSDQFTDTPSQNFAVMNPGDQDPTTATTLSEGNLKVSMGTAAGDGIRGTLPYNGKMYWEVELDSVATNSGSDIGIATKNHNLALESKSASNTNAFLGVSSFDSNLRGFFAGSPVDTSYGGLGNNFATAGKYLMFAVDISAGKFWAGYDGTWFNSGDPAAGTNDSGFDLNAFDTWFPAISRIGSASSEDFIFNFGQRSFAHTVPTGFSKLNQDNLDDTASKLTAWAWIKNRDATDNHSLFDRVRGVSQLKNTINGDNTAPLAESTDANSVQRFLQRGVQLGSSSAVNTANQSYVLWQWLMGDSATTGTVLSNPGAIDATVITADTGHLSVGTYTGTGSSSNFLHGMGGKPEFVAIYCRNQNTQPISTGSEYYSGSDYYMYLSYSNAQSNSSGTTIWPSDRTTTAIPVGTNGTVNASGDTYGFFAFRSVPGVCKVGTYVGNNTDDNAYISLGFKPRFFMCKMITGSSQWHLIDSARSPTNEGQIQSFANLDNAEQNSALGAYDLLSDGIKIRSDAGYEPGNTGTWLYIAMADIAGGGTLPPIYGR